MKSRWSVVTVYEGESAEHAAVSFCDALVERFWPRFDFDVSSWSFAALENADARERGARTATEADLVVFSIRSGQELPRHVRGWIESWLARRQEREGTLVALRMENESGETLAHAYLRCAAHQAGMDFLTDVPEHIHDPFSDSAEAYTARASQVTTVLDDILRQPPAPPAF